MSIHMSVRMSVRHVCSYVCAHVCTPCLFICLCVCRYVMSVHEGAEIFNGHSGMWHLHYAPLAHYHMPKTLTVTLGEVLESGNAKNRVNLTCSVCARCGDEVLCGAGTPFFGHVQMSACERA